MTDRSLALAAVPAGAARRAVLAALAACLAGCAAPLPPAAPADVRQALAPTGSLRLGVYPGSPTSLVRGPGGDESRGLTVEVGRELARRLGVPAQLRVYERVPQIIDALKAGEVDLTITNASPARAREVDFTPTVVRIETGYLARAGGPSTLAEVDRPGVRVGVAQGSTSQGVLAREIKAATLVTAPSVPAAAEMLRQGELDAFATNKGILFEMADRVPGARVLDGRWGLEQLAVAVPQGRGAGAAWLREQVADPALQRVVQDAAARAGLRGLATDAPR